MTEHDRTTADRADPDRAKADLAKGDWQSDPAGLEQTSAVDPHPTWRPISEDAEVNALHRNSGELPPVGYPIGEEAIADWFQRTFNRMPQAAEIGVIQDAMARRDSEQQASEPPNERVLPDR